MYTERRSTIRHAVVWSASSPESEDQLVLPDGCMDLLWHDDQLFFAGPDTHAYATTWTASEWVGIRFACGQGRLVAGIPAAELRDTRITIDALLPAAEARQLSERVAEATDPGVALEKITAERLSVAPHSDGLAERMYTMLSRGWPVADVAHHTGLSSRQLHRRSIDSFGYGPKTLGRILRLNRALDLARAGMPPSVAAARSGYADQAHFARDARSLTGQTVTSLLK
ncbi:helix-turn-helix transcriptional regulator [Hoyosella subflava]|uniref:AraC family transcription regulator n=1 Tax=Hoyosella subflava (strain DSM 45089 / JCM 17490 / NBRC 109087 / DQS3-9A1) TaxID=443218 RepID=F6EEZ4_HOYSD|nr:helix-turn-helix domain-containing protein [Hoyosella subflava]AEF42131.1 AraC family transcription regulator [Hoyosella subflava DQS3-9A1]